jgi:hypothetical protein
MSDGDEFRLAPPDCPSREDWQRKLAPPIAIQPPAKPNEWPRFGITDLLVVTGGAAIGLAGGTWMPADFFAAILGLATLLALLVVHLFPPQTRLGKLLWAALVTGYVTAVLVALIRSAGA